MKKGVPDYKKTRKEIEKLQKSDAVRLALLEEEMGQRNIQLQALKNLQALERRGLELQAAGVTMANMEETLSGAESGVEEG